MLFGNQSLCLFSGHADSLDQENNRRRRTHGGTTCPHAVCRSYFISSYVNRFIAK